MHLRKEPQRSPMLAEVSKTADQLRVKLIVHKRHAGL